jgi:hypothetical protein
MFKSKYHTWINMEGNNNNYHNQKFFFDEEGYNEKVTPSLTKYQAMGIIDEAIDTVEEGSDIHQDLKLLKDWIKSK